MAVAKVARGVCLECGVRTAVDGAFQHAKKKGGDQQNQRGTNAGSFFFYAGKPRRKKKTSEITNLAFNLMYVSPTNDTWRKDMYVNS